MWFSRVAIQYGLYHSRNGQQRNTTSVIVKCLCALRGERAVQRNILFRDILS